MSITLVHKFQKMHERKFGQSITMHEAERNLLNLMSLVRQMANYKEKYYGE